MLDGQYRGFDIRTEPPGIAIITFNQPDRLNALTRGMSRDLREIMAQAQNDDDTRVVVLTGTGRGFCAGDDVAESQTDPAPPTLVPSQVRSSRNQPVNQYPLLRTYSQELVRSIRNLDKLTIAAINGVTIQIGL
ncbi:MAG: 2-(1,2-epoxy,2-dihydrophenyl)acetyl-CoA isomerase, partial [Acidimicrobiia bacterium]|nr:2-(1,2-epoxy,2-dihydrophenyl)acetyl-CoA isomerase [Acidimicrobiia bacterium]